MTDFKNTPELSESTEPAISYSTCYDQCLSDVYNEDCIEVMKRYPDNYFDLAIVDPPYGIGEDGLKNHSRGKATKATKYTPKNWDKEPPQEEYFNELFRVSKNQIIFGANHFIERINKNSSCWIVWNKLNTGDFADCELAWTSFNTAVRKFDFMWNGMLQGDMKNKENRIHPTQKPVRLYDWILKNYAKEHQTILDTHLGSGSSRISANKAGVHFVGCEIDKEYFDKQNKRYADFISQQRLF
jgi:site-specific DNA-methyltransferase (adenine-specific)